MEFGATKLVAELDKVRSVEFVFELDEVRFIRWTGVVEK